MPLQCELPVIRPGFDPSGIALHLLFRTGGVVALLLNPRLRVLSPLRGDEPGW